jgi:hypothetical protein
MRPALDNTDCRIVRHWLDADPKRSVLVGGHLGPGLSLVVAAKRPSHPCRWCIPARGGAPTPELSQIVNSGRPFGCSTWSTSKAFALMAERIRVAMLGPYCEVDAAGVSSRDRLVADLRATEKSACSRCAARQASARAPCWCPVPATLGVAGLCMPRASSRKMELAFAWLHQLCARPGWTR